jgi:hypothetical protein
MRRATIALLALTASTHAWGETPITLMCKGTQDFFSPRRYMTPRQVTASLIVDFDTASVVFNGTRADFMPGTTSQDSVLWFELQLFTDGNGKPVPRNYSGSPVQAYSLRGSIDRVSGAASIDQAQARAPDPNDLFTRADTFDLVCKPAKPLF